MDYVYDVAHFVRAGETILSTGRNVFSGGKGLNQSVAAAKAGLSVYHAGLIGTDGDILLKTLQENGVHTGHVSRKDAAGGHTIIQVDRHGQNCIMVYGGTNRMITKEDIDRTMEEFSRGDLLMLQNETNQIAYMIEKAHEKGMNVLLNPSPFNEEIGALPLDLVDYFIVNEIEGEELSGTADDQRMIPEMRKRYPDAKIVLTLGKDGALYFDGQQVYRQPAVPVQAVDTTAAGDTFLGYFIYGIVNQLPPQRILEIAAKAASIAVSRKGAAVSIPVLEEVLAG